MDLKEKVIRLNFKISSKKLKRNQLIVAMETTSAQFRTRLAN